MKKIAIMQPYFLAYLGYFQLIYAVDQFVIYDNIEYTKKGWFNRNKFLMNDAAKSFTIPIKKDSDYLHVNKRILAKNAPNEKRKILAQIENSYRKTPYFQQIMPVLKEVFLYQSDNLFEYIFYSVKTICKILSIQTEIKVSSNLKIDHQLKGEEKVISICNELGANEYINSVGGKKLYKKSLFEYEDIDLKFIKMKNVKYTQDKDLFIPNLSIIDVLMFNGIEETKELLKKYELENGQKYEESR